MQAVRHEIRIFSGIPGARFETYMKSLFVQKHGLTCYIPKEYACIAPSRLLRTLFFKHPHLTTKEMRLISKATFTDDPPNHPAGKRSRVGDGILLFDSPALLEKLKPYDEDHKFQLSRNFNITLKGGQRGEAKTINIAPSVTASVFASTNTPLNQQTRN